MFVVSSWCDTQAVRIVLDTKYLIEHGFVQPECNDILFSSSPVLETGSTLPYWIDPTPGCDSQSTIVFVKISNAMTTALTTTLYLFSGSVLAPKSSDLYSVFSFGYVDEFEDPDLPGWSTETPLDCLSMQYSAVLSAFNSSDEIKYSGEHSLKVEASSEFGSALTKSLSGYLTNTSEYMVQVL